MRFSCPVVTAAFVVLSFGGAIASAQTPIYGAVNDAASRPTAGWVFTPAIGYVGTWDDNVLVLTKGNIIPSGFTDGLNPRLSLEFRSRRAEFLSSYDGSFINYRDLTTLNSFDHRATVNTKRMLTRRLTLFARGSALTSPTTDLVGLVAVPYVRLGSRLATAQGGLEMAFTKRTVLTGAYNTQWVDFDLDPLFGVELLGGHSRGATVGLTHQLNRQLALTADYDITQATVVHDSHFAVQNGTGGVEWQPSQTLRVFGGAGISSLRIPESSISRRGLSWRAGVSRRFGTSGSFDASYDRSFVPTYSFGGTSQNEELVVGLTMPIARRLYTRSDFAVRRNRPLIVGLPLDSVSYDAAVGYLLRPWMQIEGFYNSVSQTIDRPGGELDRHRVGFQIITAKPVRIH